VCVLHTRGCGCSMWTVITSRASSPSASVAPTPATLAGDSLSASGKMA
jgi:hypothetical protein